MTVLEQRFFEQVPKELHTLNENLETIIYLLLTENDGKDIV